MNPPVLPLKANEAAALADLIYRQVDGKTLTPELRMQFGEQAEQLGLETVVPLAATLARDPVYPSTYYIAISTSTSPMLLHIALASTPPNELIPDAVLVGRMRPGGGREIVIEALPFPFADREYLREGDPEAFKLAISRMFGISI